MTIHDMRWTDHEVDHDEGGLEEPLLGEGAAALLLGTHLRGEVHQHRRQCVPEYSDIPSVLLVRCYPPVHVVEEVDQEEDCEGDPFSPPRRELVSWQQHPLSSQQILKLVVL